MRRLKAYFFSSGQVLAVALIAVIITVHVKPSFAEWRNDDFSDRYQITGASGETSGSNIRASKERGEPDHAGNDGGHSVWWTWTAPATGYVTFDTLGSRSFDTLLAVYTGSSVSRLVEVDSNDDAYSDTFRRTTRRQSEVRFMARQGQTYQIAVDGYNRATGRIVLSWQQEVSDSSGGVDDPDPCPPAIPPYNPPPTGDPDPPTRPRAVEVTIMDRCNDGYRIDLRFFAYSSSWRVLGVWPSSRGTFHTRSYGVEYTRTFPCTPQTHKICFGAKTGVKTWGVDHDDGSGSCVECCYECPSSGTERYRSQPLICQ